MKPLESAARFAAFAWYIDYRQAPSQISQAEARKFANENWDVFLPMANEGWGRLLLEIAKARPTRQCRPTSGRAPPDGVAVAPATHPD